MNFKEVEFATPDGTQTHIILDLGDGAFKSFPAIAGNPEYDAWLESQTPAPKTAKK